MDYVADGVKGVWNGAVGAVEETGQFVWDVGNAVGLTDEEYFPGHDAFESVKFETRTAVGDITSTITSVGLGMLLAGKFLRAKNLLQGGGKLTTFARGALTGAFADTVMVDPEEDRLSNLFQSFPALENPITEYLAADEDDGRLEGRMKNAVEGLLLGAAMEGILLGSVRLYRAMLKNDAKAVEEILPKLEHDVATSRGTADTLEEAVPTPTQASEKVVKVADPSETKPLAESKTNLKDAPRDAADILPEPERLPPIDLEELWSEVAAKAVTFEDMLKHIPEVLNHRNLRITDEGAMAHFEALARRAFKHSKLGKEGQKSLVEITGGFVRDMEDFGLDTSNYSEKLLAAQTRSDLLEELTIQSYLDRTYFDGLRKQAYELGLKLQSQANPNPLDVLKQQLLHQAALEFEVAVKNQSSAWGRGLVAWRRLTEPYKELFAHLDEEKIANAIKAGRTPDNDLVLKALEKQIKKGVKRGHFKDINAWLRIMKEVDFSNEIGTARFFADFNKALYSRRTSDYFTEVYLNNILSTPRTHATNIVSNAVKLFLTPLERSIGHLTPGKGFDPVLAKQELAAWYYIGRHLKSSWRLAKKAYHDPEAARLMGAGKWSETASGSAAMNALSADNVIGRHIKKGVEAGKSLKEAAQVDEFTQFRANLAENMGKYLGWPSRWLRAQDTFFKRLAYISEVETKALMEATAKEGLSSQEVGAYVAAQSRKAFDRIGRPTDKDALNHASRATWTQDLPEESFGRWLQKLQNSDNQIMSLPLKVVVPFIRTPTNLLYDAVDHTPIVSMATKRYREAQKAGGRELAEMRGKMAVGSSAIALSMILAFEGSLTGSGPSNPQEKEALLRTGWRPNSIKIGDSYMSFNRADPFSTLMTMTANFVDALPFLTEGQISEFGAVLMAGTLQTMGDKSYLEGLGNLLDAIQGDERAQGRLWRNSLSSFVVPGLVREGAKYTDPVTRDVNSVWGRIASSLPGASVTQPPKYDWLTGKPVTAGMREMWGNAPINEDAVARELVNLGGVGKSPAYMLGGVDLSPEQHSEYARLIGTVRINGKNLHQTLNTLIRSPQYDLTRSKNFEMDGGRRKEVLRIVSAFRAQAQSQLKQQFPELRQAINAAGQDKKLRNAPNGSLLMEEPPAPPTRTRKRNLQQLKEFIQ